MSENTGIRRTEKAFRDFEREFVSVLGHDFKTAEQDRFNRELVRRGADVSFLKGVVLERQEFHRTYFQVSLAQLPDAETQFEFIERNFDLLQDWWHVDQLTQFLHKVEFGFALRKAGAYVLDPRPYVRRWGYVLFIPSLIKTPGAAERLFPLFRDNDEYTVQMAEAWLLSFLAVRTPGLILDFLRNAHLRYSITGKTIQKICDSFRISDDWKAQFRALRAPLRMNGAQ